MDTHHEMFKDELLKDEKILWSGQPNPNIHFTGADVFVIPLSLLWGGFAIVWEIVVISSGAPIFMAIFGMLFVLPGLHFMFGRFIYKAYKKKRTFYAITNQRVIALTKLSGVNFQAEFIDRIPSMSKIIRKNGNGTIKFGNAPYWMAMYWNTGMEFFNWYGSDALSFYDVDDAQKLYEIVNEQRRKQPAM